MVQEANFQQVASFQVFVRDNKPKMNAYYPFLSQEQILSKLRQQWKKLDDSKRQTYSKLVLTKKKAVKITKVKVVKITKCRLPKSKQTGTSKNARIVRNNDDDNDFGFNNLSDDSYINDDYELDSRSENSPFMRNKFAIDSLNSGICCDTNKPTENVKKCGVGKTFGSCVARVVSETVDNCKTGIPQAPCKDRRNSKGCVRFSAVKETVSDHKSYESYDEDPDDGVLYIESSTRSKTKTSYESTCRNKAVRMMMPRRLNLQEVEDHSLMLSLQNNPATKYSLAGGELKMPQSKYSLASEELKMPQSKYSLASEDLKMPQLKYSLAGGELKMPQSKYSLASGELKMPQSKYSLASEELKMLQSKYCLSGGELKMPQSKYSLAGGELKIPKSKYSLAGGELKMPQSKYSLAGGELKMPRLKYSLAGGKLKIPQSKYSLAGGELKMPQLKKQKLRLETLDKTTTVIPSESTSSRLSRRLRSLSPDDVATTLCGHSLHGSSAVYLNKKPKMNSEFCKKEILSVKNNITSFERKVQLFCSEFQKLAAEVKVRSCRHDNGNATIDDQDELQIVSDETVGAHGNFQSEHRLNKELQKKAAVDRGSVPTNSSFQSKSENTFQRKNSKSVQKQKNKSKMQKKSAVTRKHTIVNRVHGGNNNVKRSRAGTFDNYSINDSLTSPVALEYDIIQQESYLDNSNTNEEVQHESDLDNSSTNEEIQYESDLDNSSTNEEIQYESNLDNSNTNEESQYESDLDNSSTNEEIQHESDLDNSNTNEEIQHENDLDNSNTNEEIQHENDLDNSSTTEEIQHERDLNNLSTSEEIQHESDLDNSNKNDIIHESHLNNSSTNKIIHFSSQLNNSSTKHTKEFGGQQFPSCKDTKNVDVENLKLPTDFSKESTKRLQSGLLLEEDCNCTSNIDCRKNCQIDCKNMSIVDCRNDPQILWKAENGFSSDQESGCSDNSLGSENEETNHDDFLKNMTDQTTSALLQAIDRLKSLTPPQVRLTGEGVPDGVPSDLPENNDLASVSTESLFLSGMFQDVPQNFNRAFVTPAKKRLLASSATETPSNFMAMFDDGDIFL